MKNLRMQNIEKKHPKELMENNQSIKQKMIAVAQGDFDAAIIQIIRDIVPQKPLVANTEWETIVNTITLDVTSSILRDVVNRLKFIREGGLHDE